VTAEVSRAAGSLCSWPPTSISPTSRPRSTRR
jgi:hypothetical protein